MARGVARYLVGSLVVLGLAACGKMMFAEREPWRHEAEVACLKSGQVKEGASLVRVDGPTQDSILNEIRQIKAITEARIFRLGDA